MSEIEIVWKDPPVKTTTSLWADRLRPLRDRPGDWAMVRQGTPARISGLRGRLVKTVALKDVFEFRTAKLSDEESELYARFIGDVPKT